MKQRLMQRILSCTGFVELMVSWGWIVVGVTLLLPTQIFTSQSYHFLASLAPEDTVGVIQVAIGLAALLIFLFGSDHMRRASMFFNAGLYVFYVIQFLLSAPSTGTVYAVFAAGALCAYWRLGLTK